MSSPRDKVFTSVWDWLIKSRLLLLIAVGLFSGCASREQTPGACRLQPRAQESVSRFVLSSRVHHLQRDPRWGAEAIGGSGKPLRAVGCAICCLSMALAQHGIERTPAELNRELKAAGGYSSKGWVRWSAVKPASGGQSHVEILWRPRLRDIEAALAAGNPVLVKVAPPPMVQHWVLLVGRDGKEFLIKDPLDDRKTLKPLSSLRSRILAVRVVKRQ